MRQTKAVAIVVPTLNEAAAIRRVVATLLAGLPAAFDVRLYVADGGSEDGTLAIVADLARGDPRVMLLPNPDRLQSAAVNHVAAAAADWADVLIRADAHAGYPQGFVARVVNAIAANEADSVVAPMDSVGSNCLARAIAWASDTRLGSGGSAHRGGRASGWVDHGHHAGWQLASFLAAGGYDPSYSHNEDAELDCRITRSGGRIWLDASIRLDYHVRTSFGALWRQYRNYGRGRSRTVRRHPGSMRARQLAVPAFVGASAAALLVAPLLPTALLLPAGYAAILAAASVEAAVKRRSACGLLVGAAAAVMHIAWAAGFAEGMLTIREPRWPGPAGVPA